MNLKVAIISFFKVTIMRKFSYSKIILSSALLASNTILAKNIVMVDGNSMAPSKDIVDNPLNSAGHSTLLSPLKAAELADSLKGKDSFTVFAPTNATLCKLPAGTADTLVKSEHEV
ncbi:MAG: fasciclin domain-containing protein [Glaciimonas sp.]|nr:fasciclin domain-containing protein [Glaciimonas sp.]